VPGLSHERILSIGSALGFALLLSGCGGSAGTPPPANTAGLTPATSGSPRFVRGTSGSIPQTYASLPGDGQSHTFTFALRPQDFGDATTSAPGTTYAHPITLTLAETGDSGHASLLLNGVAVGTTATVTSSGQTAALRYDGLGSVSYTTLTTMTSPGFAAESVRISPLYVEPLDVHWISSDALLTPLVIPVTGLSVYLDAIEVDAPSSVKYTATPTRGCNGVATVSISGPNATVTGGLNPAMVGPCSVTISDGSSSVTTNVENRIAGPDRTGIALLTTYWPPDLLVEEAGGGAGGIDIGSYVEGPQGAVYFWEDEGNPAKIGRITTSGAIVEVPAPSGHRGFSMAAGPDGNLWVISVVGPAVDRVTLSGSFTTFPIPQAVGLPMSITAGPDNALWFTTSQGQLCRITTAGVVTEFPLPNGYAFSGGPPFVGITTGPDGNLWFGTVSAIGRSTPNGTITMFPIAPNSYPDGITSGPDGNIWFTENSGNAIGRITPGGTVTEFPLPRPSSKPESIVAARDGNLYFTLEAGNVIDKISVSGAISEFGVPNIVSNGAIVDGSDGNLWLGNGDSIQKLQGPTRL
jgi:streptogramin lyase